MEENTNGGGDLVADGDDNSVTMVDVLKGQEELEEDANAVLGGSDDKECTYTSGYVKRQALYACLTCCTDSRTDPTQWAGICLACSFACHENHNLVELYTKRNFRCDCGGPKFPNQSCVLYKDKGEPNTDNVYNQNFGGLYCVCHRPYPDPESTEDDEMIQCIICEDWLHSKHLNAAVPSNELYSEMICEQCMDSKKFLCDYTIYALEDQNIENLNKSDTEQIDILEVSNIDTDNISAGPKEPMEIDEAGLSSEDKVVISSEDKIVINSEKLLDQNKPDIVLSTLNENETPENESNDQKPFVESSKIVIDIPSESVKDIVTDNDLVKPIVSDKKVSSNKDPNDDNEPMETDSQSGEVELSKSLDDQQEDKEEVHSKCGQPASDQTLEDQTAKIAASLLPQSSDGDINSTKHKADIEDNPSIASTDIVSIKDCTSDESVNETGLNAEEGNKNDTNNQEKIDDNSEKSLEDRSDTNEHIKAENIGEKAPDASEQENNVLEIVNDNPTFLQGESSKKKELLEHTEGEKLSNVEEESSTEKEKSAELEQECYKEIDGINTIKDLMQTDDDREFLENKKKSEIENRISSEDVDNNSNKMEGVITDENIKSDDAMNCGSKNKDVVKPTEEILDSNNLGTDSIDNKVITTENINSQNSTDDIKDGDMEKSETENSEDQKRKLNSEDDDLNNLPNKKCKLDIIVDQPVVSCKRPSNLKRNKGATFWPCTWRKQLCSCTQCVTMYRDKNVLFLLDDEDTVSAYEDLGKSKCHSSQYEKGLKALSSLDRIQQINALTEYNNMKEKLLDFLKTFKEKKEVVKDEDIKKFFAGMKPKREPDGVYFYR